MYVQAVLAVYTLLLQCIFMAYALYRCVVPAGSPAKPSPKGSCVCGREAAALAAWRRSELPKVKIILIFDNDYLCFVFAIVY